MLTKHVLSHYDDITQLKQRNKHTKKKNKKHDIEKVWKERFINLQGPSDFLQCNM